MTNQNAPINDLLIERLLLGELSEQQAKEVTNGLEREGRRELLKQMQESNKQILARYPADWMARIVKSKVETPATVSPNAWASSFRFVAAFAVLLIAAPTITSQFATSNTLEVTRSKGVKQSISVHRMREGSIEPLAPDSDANEGDQLQLSYRTDNQYGVLFSVDGRGTLTIHHPIRGSRAALLSTKERTSLAESYELDDAPQFERFHLISADNPFLLTEILDQAEAQFEQNVRTDELRIPEGYSQTSFTLRKNQ